MKDEINKVYREYFERISVRGNNRSRIGFIKIETSDELKKIEDIFSLRIEQVIAKSILDFEDKNPSIKGKLRDDAKVLLVINFTDMVYYPLTISREFDRRDLKVEIYHEIQMILTEANKENVEISSHKILETGLKLWKRLKTLGNDSW